MNDERNIPKTQENKDEILKKAKALLQEFRESLYNFFPYRADALMDLIDAVASNTTARSVVELSLSPFFRREYSSLFAAIENFFVPSKPEKEVEEKRLQEQEILHLIAPYLATSEQRKYHLFCTDVTYLPRQFSKTLEDRTFVHCPNTIKGNTPVTIGHDYSVLSYLPEKTSPNSPPWVVPLIVRRVQSIEKATQVSTEQIEAVATDDTLPFKDKLSVLVEDSAYSSVVHLGSVATLPKLVSEIRFPKNRVVYHKYELPEGEKPSSGHPTWYGKRFALKEPDTWDTPDERASTTFTTKKGKVYTVELEGWHDMLRKGKHDMPMHKYPFTLFRAEVLDEDGNRVFKHDMWIIVIGKRRRELSLIDIWEIYAQRYDTEHFFRYGKQRLLMASFQTPVVEHEENWWKIVQLAYTQLWLARSLAIAMPRPWERHATPPEQGNVSPSTVQKNFERIIQELGTPAKAPKRKNNSKGRAKGTKPPPRKRHPVIKKS